MRGRYGAPSRTVLRRLWLQPDGPDLAEMPGMWLHHRLAACEAAERGWRCLFFSRKELLTGLGDVLGRIGRALLVA